MVTQVNGGGRTQQQGGMPFGLAQMGFNGAAQQGRFAPSNMTQQADQMMTGIMADFGKEFNESFGAQINGSISGFLSGFMDGGEIDMQAVLGSLFSTDAPNPFLNMIAGQDPFASFAPVDETATGPAPEQDAPPPPPPPAM